MNKKLEIYETLPATTAKVDKNADSLKPTKEIVSVGTEIRNKAIDQIKEDKPCDPIPQSITETCDSKNITSTTSVPAIKNTNDTPQQDNSFMHKLKVQFAETGKLYMNLFKHPSLFVKGFVEVVRDFGYELPKSLFSNKKYSDKNEEKDVRASQALGISEISGVLASMGGVAAVEAMGFTGSLEATAGLIGSNYLAAVISYIGSYVLLSRGRKDYTKQESFSDGLKVVKECVPAAVVLYATETPIMNGLAQFGLSNSISAAITLLLGIIFFTGVAKAAAKTTMSK